MDNELFGALEYDLKRYIQEDIRGLFVKPAVITFRQVMMWIRHLPEESALARRHFAGEVKPGDRDRLLVAVINELRMFQYWYKMVNKEEKSRLPEPDLIELPE